MVEVYDNQGSTPVRIDGDASTGNLPVALGGILPVGATAVSKYISAANTGATIHTVTSGKTFHATGFCVMNGAAANNVWNLGTFLGGITRADRSPTLFTGIVMFTVASGTAITLTHSFGAGNGYAALWGYEI